MMTHHPSSTHRAGTALRARRHGHDREVGLPRLVHDEAEDQRPLVGAIPEQRQWDGYANAGPDCYWLPPEQP